MVQRHIRNRGQLALAALCLAIALAGCGPSAGTPAQTAQPTQAPVSAPATAQPAPIPPTSVPAPPAAPTAAPPTSVPASPAPPAPTAIPTPASTAADPVAAIQTVLDYYAAINQQAYDRAYHLWAQNGAASGQTYDQFRQGFAGTVQVRVQIGKASAHDGAVTVPTAITAVVNVTTQEQQVRRFGGTYSVQADPNGWRLAGAKIAAADGDTQPPADVGDPLALLQAYYAAINDRDFGRAYTYWSNNGAASQQTFAQFREGYAATDRVTIEAGKPQEQGAAGSSYATTPIVIMATQTDGTPQTFCGSYLLRQLHVPPFEELGWRIERASIAAVAPVQPGSDAVQRLLTNGCTA